MRSKRMKLAISITCRWIVLAMLAGMVLNYMPAGLYIEVAVLELLFSLLLILVITLVSVYTALSKVNLPEDSEEK